MSHSPRKSMIFRREKTFPEEAAELEKKLNQLTESLQSETKTVKHFVPALGNAKLINGGEQMGGLETNYVAMIQKLLASREFLSDDLDQQVKSVVNTFARVDKANADLVMQSKFVKGFEDNRKSNSATTAAEPNDYCKSISDLKLRIAKISQDVRQQHEEAKKAAKLAQAKSNAKASEEVKKQNEEHAALTKANLDLFMALTNKEVAFLNSEPRIEALLEDQLDIIVKMMTTTAESLTEVQEMIKKKRAEKLGEYEAKKAAYEEEKVKYDAEMAKQTKAKEAKNAPTVNGNSPKALTKQKSNGKAAAKPKEDGKDDKPKEDGKDDKPKEDSKEEAAQKPAEADEKKKESSEENKKEAEELKGEKSTGSANKNNEEQNEKPADAEKNEPEKPAEKKEASEAEPEKAKDSEKPTEKKDASEAEPEKAEDSVKPAEKKGASEAETEKPKDSKKEEGEQEKPKESVADKPEEPKDSDKPVEKGKDAAEEKANDKDKKSEDKKEQVEVKKQEEKQEEPEEKKPDAAKADKADKELKKDEAAPKADE